MKSKPDEDRGFLYEIMCIFSLAAAIDDIQEEEESHYSDRLREYNLYADSIRYTVITIVYCSGSLTKLFEDSHRTCCFVKSDRPVCILTVCIRLFLCVRCRVMTRKQQLRHHNVEKAEEVVAAKNAQKEELVKAVNH